MCYGIGCRYEDSWSGTCMDISDRYRDDAACNCYEPEPKFLEEESEEDE